jgi:hypothetical protein
MVPTIEQLTTLESEASPNDIRYAPADILDNLNAIIATVRPNPKRPGTKCYYRYGRFHLVGITIGQYIASYVAVGLSVKLARNDLRWDWQHKFITLKTA